MARRQDSQTDEVALAKLRLREAGESIDTAFRSSTRHAVLIGVAASFGAGVLLASGKIKPERIIRATALVPQILAYSRIGRDALATVNQLIAARARSQADQQPSP